MNTDLQYDRALRAVAQAVETESEYESDIDSELSILEWQYERELEDAVEAYYQGYDNEYQSLEYIDDPADVMRIVGEKGLLTYLSIVRYEEAVGPNYSYEEYLRVQEQDTSRGYRLLIEEHKHKHISNGLWLDELNMVLNARMNKRIMLTEMKMTPNAVAHSIDELGSIEAMFELYGY
jgi:hypothetical protein